MKNSLSIKIGIFGLMICSLVIIGYSNLATADNFVTLAPNRDNPGNLIMGENSDVPNFAMSSDGKMVAVFGRWLTGAAQDATPAFIETDPYISFSSNGGAAWGAPQAIPGGANDRSRILIIQAMYDSNNDLHVIWVNARNGKVETDKDTLYYTNNVGQSNLRPPLLLADSLFTPLSRASIAEGPTGTINVIWDDGERVYHAKSSDSDDFQSWGSPTFVPTLGGALASNSYAVADQNGNLHLAYLTQQGQGSEQPTNVYYTQYRNGNWTPTVGLSKLSDNFADNARPPFVAASADRVFVTFTDRLSRQEQTVLLTSCRINGDCKEPSDWANLQNVTGQFLAVNDGAPYQVSGIVETDEQGNLFMYLNAISPLMPNAGEMILGANSCDTRNWSNVSLEQLTTENSNYHPRFAVADNTVHMVYERIEPANPNSETLVHKIYYTTQAFDCQVNDGRTQYLPLISRP